jgi:hypothetical protein
MALPELSVKFENADMAEWALVGLRDRGISVRDVCVKNARIGHNAGFPYVFSNFISTNETANYVPGPFDDSEKRRVYDTRSAEVILSVDIAEENRRRGEAFLISRHGVPQVH